MPVSVFSQDRGVKEDELQSILNYLLTMHEVNAGLCVEIDTPIEGQRETVRERLSGAGGKMCITICGLELWST